MFDVALAQFLFFTKCAELVAEDHSGGIIALNRLEGKQASYNPGVGTEFLDRLASQLKIGKNAACRRAIERILDIIKKNHEDGQYQSPTEAERDFRQLVEREENGK
jgi:hypothetical protein